MIEGRTNNPPYLLGRHAANIGGASSGAQDPDLQGERVVVAKETKRKKRKNKAVRLFRSSQTPRHMIGEAGTCTGHHHLHLAPIARISSTNW